MTSDTNKMVAMIIGGVLLLVGILGFFNDPVLGLFDVSVFHNIIHLLTGGVLLAAALMNHGRNARTVNLVLGITYLVVTLLGFIAPGILETLGIAINMADNWLHLLLGVVLTGVAFVNRTDVRRPIAGSRM